MSSSLFIFNCCLSRFGPVTIPVDNVKIDKFGPGSFLWLGFGKNSLKEVKLLQFMGVVGLKKKKTDVKSTEKYQTK